MDNIDNKYFTWKSLKIQKFAVCNQLILFFITFLFFGSSGILAQKIFQKEIYINNKPTIINITNFRNSSYVPNTELSRVFNFKTEENRGRITHKSANFQVTFLRGSSFVVIQYSGKEEIKQMHLPVVEINKVIYLPFPSALTLLDTAGLFQIVIDKNISKKEPTKIQKEVPQSFDEIIPENLQQITKVHNNIKNRTANPENPKEQISTSQKPEIQNESNTKLEKKHSNEDYIHKTELIPNNNAAQSKDHTESNQILDKKQTEILNKDNTDNFPLINTQSTEQKYNGYKIPNDLKRRKLQKLLGQDGI